jgi:hypothetical protein
LTSILKMYPFFNGRRKTKLGSYGHNDQRCEWPRRSSRTPNWNFLGSPLSFILDGSCQFDPITHVASRIARTKKAAVDHVDRTSLQRGLLGIFCHWPLCFDVLLCRTVTIVLRLSRPPPDFLLVPNRELDIERNFLILRNFKLW